MSAPAHILLRTSAVAVAALMLLPLLSVAWLALGRSEALAHLRATVLPDLALNTLLLMAGVGIGTALIGTGAAWLVSRYRFPGSRLLGWALALPLAVPGYLAAFVYTDLLESHIDIRSLPGAIFVFSLTLYPYVYLLARVAFVAQSAQLMEAARLLGRSPGRAFFSAALPAAWPAIAAGVALALMEVVNDYGVAAFFAIPTLTTGLFDIWLNTNDIAGAAQLALIMLALVLALLLIERRARRRRRFDAQGAAARPVVLRGWRAFAAVVLCLLPLLAGFALPVAVLGYHAVRFWRESLMLGLVQQLANSLVVAALSALLASAFALLLAFAARLDRAAITQAAVRLSAIGYAMPGALLAVGLLYPLAALDRALMAAFGLTTLLLTGSLFALVYGYNARFMALALSSVESGLARISPAMEQAARTLGCTPAAMLRRVHLPLLRPAILTGALIVFVDVLKELPLTLLLRPFGFETLATAAFQFASEEMFEEAALHGLIIVLAAMLPLIALNRTLTRGQPTP